MKEAIMAFLLALVVGAAMNGFGTATPPAPEPKPDDQQETSNADSIQEITESDFEPEVLASEKPVLVDFYADWAAPCKQMNPIIEKLAKQFDGKLKVVKLDVDSNSAISAKYNVNSIPTFLIFKAGQRVDSYTGAVPQEDLAAAVTRQL